MNLYRAFFDYCEEHAVEYEKEVPMSRLTTFRIGGPAPAVAAPKNVRELAELVALCRREGLPYLVVGNGSNLLVNDEGIEQVVLHLGRQFSALALEGENVLLCEAGANLAAVCQFAAQHALTGLEFAYGIPGSAGGALCMNAGAYGGEMADVVESAQHIDAQGILHTLERREMELAYRHSVYQESGWCITALRIRLRPGDRTRIEADMHDILERRRAKQPLELPSAGSTFKRPQGAYAAALIDRCGLKGVGVGGAQVSEKHAGFLVNTGAATCKDMLALIELVRKTVLEQTGYRLECEVKII